MAAAPHLGRVPCCMNLRKERITWTPAVIIYGLSKSPSHGCGRGAGHYQVLEIGEGSLCWGVRGREVIAVGHRYL